MKIPRLLTTVEAADLLRISVHTLIEWRKGRHKSPDLPVVYVGRRVFYRHDDLVRLTSTAVRPLALTAAGSQACPLQVVTPEGREIAAAA